MRWHVSAGLVEGTLSVPGDKSIAHRAIMLSALAPGASRIENLPGGEDVRATIGCMRSLGATIAISDRTAHVQSPGVLLASASPLNAVNSGTTMRLLAGILAGQPFMSQLTGDDSLSRRPMGRIVEPLVRMGAQITSREGRAPLHIQGGELRGIRYTLPVASAQVKSAILLAALFASGETEVVEPVVTRDHTERMLRSLGVDVRRDGDIVVLSTAPLSAFSVCVPGDPSSAAFFFTAGALTGGEVEVCGGSVNPTRTGFLSALQRMGAVVEITGEHSHMGEPVGNVRVRGRAELPIAIEAEEIPLLVDEIPLLALLATQTAGISTIRGAAELRVKETDRIAAVTAGLNAMGADIEALPDGFVIRGPTPLRGAAVSSCGDHRLAMMLAVAGTVAAGTTVVEEAEASAVSYPGFEAELARLGGQIGAV